jgi:hypothetical protein
MALKELVLPKRKFLPSKVVTADARRPIRIPNSNISYLPSEKKFFVATPKVVDRKTWYNTKSFSIVLALYVSKHPHLEFQSFHKYEDNSPQVIFIDTRKHVRVAVNIDEFIQYRSNIEFTNQEETVRDKNGIACPCPMLESEKYKKLQELSAKP